MTKEFKSREEIINALATEYGKNPASFNNTPTNKSVEKFWTFNRLLQYYLKGCKSA